MKFKMTASAPQPRIITQGAAGTNWVLVPGDVYTFSSGDVLPREFELFSAPYDGSLPPTAIMFDAADWTARTKPRQDAPPTPRWIENDICKRFGWTAEQFATARRSAGFPAPEAMMNTHKFSLESLRWKSYGVWSPEAVERWAIDVQSLGLGAAR